MDDVLLPSTAASLPIHSYSCICLSSWSSHISFVVREGQHVCAAEVVVLVWVESVSE